MSRLANVGTNALTLLILLFFFVLIYARLSGKTIGEVFSDLKEKLSGD